MPIDTQAKRMNAAEVGVPLPVSVLPGTAAAFERVQTGWTYAPLVVPVVGGVSVEEQLAVGTFSGITMPDIDVGAIQL